jgi:hypothetical protein
MMFAMFEEMMEGSKNGLSDGHLCWLHTVARFTLCEYRVAECTDVSVYPP